MQSGRQWGNRDIPWKVEPNADGLRIHLVSGHFGSGGSMDVWFQKDVGVVEEHYTHNGTYDEYTKKLLSFAPNR